MNRNNMPLILMLGAGAVTCLVTMMQEYTMVERLIVLLIVLILFYLLGSILKWTLNFFDSQNEKRNKEAGEVIEKEAEGETEGLKGAKVTKESESKS